MKRLNMSYSQTKTISLSLALAVTQRESRRGVSGKTLAFIPCLCEKAFWVRRPFIAHVNKGTPTFHPLESFPQTNTTIATISGKNNSAETEMLSNAMQQSHFFFFWLFGFFFFASSRLTHSAKHRELLSDGRRSRT